MGKDKIESYRDLNVWQRTMSLAAMTYELTRKFPREEIFGIIQQLRRAAVSVPANIAEGYGRNSTADYVRFLHIAQGSLKEWETLLLLARQIGICAETESESLLRESTITGKMLHTLIGKLRKS